MGERDDRLPMEDLIWAQRLRPDRWRGTVAAERASDIERSYPKEGASEEEWERFKWAIETGIAYAIGAGETFVPKDLVKKIRSPEAIAADPEVISFLNFWSDPFLSGDAMRKAGKGSEVIWEAIRSVTEEKMLQIDKEAGLRGELTPEKQERKTALRILAAHASATEIFHKAFLNRAWTAGNQDVTKKVYQEGFFDTGYNSIVFPDRMHWRALFAEEFAGERGLLMDQILRKIVEYGLKGIELEVELEDGRRIKRIINPYAEGFTDDIVFGKWLAGLLEVAKGRIDLVLETWHLALLWEIPGHFGATIVEEEKKFPDGSTRKVKLLKIGNPPIVPHWMTTAGRLMSLKGLVEGGWPIPQEVTSVDQLTWDKIRKILLTERYLSEICYSHVGSPLSIGVVGGVEQPLIDTYLHSVKVKHDGQEKSFWELWWEEGIPLGDLPWGLTERVVAGQDEQAELATFEGWAAITRGRAIGIAKRILEVPSLEEMANKDFWRGLVRTWAVKMGISREQRRWIMLAWLYPYTRCSEKERTSDRTNAVLRGGSQDVARWVQNVSLLNKGEAREPALSRILEAAIVESFIQPKDAEWIKKMIDKSPTEVLRSEKPF